MNKSIKTSLIGIVLSIIVSFNTFGQVSNLTLGKEYEAYRDSLKKTPYPWKLPILGEQLRAQGFDIPYPSGIMINYAWSLQQITLDHLAVSLDPDKEKINVDGLARFYNITSQVQAITARYDFYLLPFLNLSVVGGRIFPDTDVHLALPFDMEFPAGNPGWSVGWGAVVAGAVGQIVMQTDINMIWTFMPNMDNPARGIVADARVGYMLRFKNKPERNLVFLIGGQYMGLNPANSGKADLSSVAGITPEKKQDAQEQLNGWYDGLPDNEQELLSGIYDGLSSWLSNDDPLYIYYDIEKSLYYPLSLNLGFNFQINHRYQLNAFYTFLGSREQIVVGLCYRFGFKGKNLLSGVTL